MKKITVFLTFLLFTCFLSAQNEKAIDSLKNELKSAEKSIDKATIYYNLGLEYLYIDKIESLRYFNSTENILIETNSKDELFPKLYNAKADLFRRENKFIKSDSLYKLSNDIASKINKKKLYYKISSLMGINTNKYYSGNRNEYINGFVKILKLSKKLDTTKPVNLNLKYTIIGNYAIALASKGKLKEALPLFKKDLFYKKNIYIKGDVLSQEKLLKSMSNVALCYDKLNNSSKALEIYFEALKVEKNNPTENINLIYNNLSSLLNKQTEYKKAIKYALLVQSKNPYFNYKSNNSIGVAYMNLKNYALSTKFYIKAIENAKEIKNKNNLAQVYSNLGHNYLELKKLDSSFFYLKKSKNSYINLNDSINENYINSIIGRLFLKKKDYKKSLKYLLDAEKMFNYEDVISNKHILNTEYIYKSYKGLKDNPKALYWLEKLNKINEIYLDDLKNNTVKELETKYQTKQKETKILTLQNENIKKEAKLTKSRYTIYGILSTLLLVLGLTYFFWHKRKQQQKLALLENTVKTSEEEKQRIGKELHDGIAGSIIKLVYETEGTQLDISDKLLKTYNEVRTLSHQLDNSNMHNELFMDRVLELVPNDFKDKMFTISINPNHLKLEEPYGTHIYRIIQELITNNLKYAKATKTTLILAKKGEILEFVYKDDGIGIKKLKKGNGLKNIEDRIELMKGKFNLNIKKEKGIEITFTIPYKPKVN